MKRYKFISLLVMGLAGGWGCTPSFIYNPNPTVYVRRDLPEKEVPSKLVVLPFESPFYCSEVGMYASRLFYRQLLERKAFTSISFSQEADWFERGSGWLEKTRIAMQEGEKSEADYILIGSVDYYMLGYSTANRVTVTVRLIEVATGETIYFATGYGSGKPGNTYLLLGAKAGEHTPSTTSVLYAVVERMVKDCFKKGWFKFI